MGDYLKQIVSSVYMYTGTCLKIWDGFEYDTCTSCILTRQSVAVQCHGASWLAKKYPLLINTPGIHF